MRLKTLFGLLAICISSTLFAQSPPQIPLTGNIGVPGSVAILGGVTVQMPSDANYTLTPAQWSNKTLIITSAASLSATRNVIAPLNKGQEFNVENNTTGGQSIQIIGATGAGITIPNGVSNTVFSDGTNYLTGPVPAPFIGTSGIVCNTSTTASKNCGAPDINATLGYTPATGPNFTTDFAACFLFTETATAGGPLVDHCGSNNGVVGSVAPVAVGTGWQWTTTTTKPVVLPAALNSAKSFYFVVNVPPAYGGNYVSPQVNTILGPTVAGNLTINATGFLNPSQPFGGFGAFANGVETAETNNYFNGVAILTLVCGTGPGGIDSMYFNGTLTQNFISAKNSCLKMSSGSFEIGGSVESTNFSGSFQLYDLRMSFNAHSATTVAQNVAALYNEALNRGVTFSPNRYVYPIQQLLFAGDSINCGFNTGGSPACTAGTTWSPGTVSSNAYTNHLTLDQAFGIQNFGASGAIVQQQVAAAPQLYGPLCSTQSGQSIGLLFEGTNNAGLTTPAATWAAAAAWAGLMHSYGCKAIYTAMISRGGSYSGGAGTGTYESFKAAYNALARANWKQAGFDAFIDLEADPFLGCVGCSTNLAYFTSDSTHPNPTGQLKLALPVQATVNYLSNGSTPNNPNPTTITAATYTSAYEDGGLNFDTASNNIVDTLTSAQWMTGRIISRCNNSTAGSNTLTITAPSDYPFNNASGFTSIIIPTNTCQKFQGTFIAGTPNGDYWRLVQ